MICPSILSADFSMLKETLSDMETAGLKIVHFDVMDNHFVPNLTFGHKLIQDLRKHSRLFFDVHLMIDAPEKDLNHYIQAGSDLITVHLEAIRNSKIDMMSRQVRQAGKKFGVSIKPQTPVSSLVPILQDLDLVLVMTVEPGFGGQKLIQDCLPKISELKQLQKNLQLDFLIQVDGGIDQSNLKAISDLGADWFVIGSAFFKENDFQFYPNLLSGMKKS